MLNQKLIIILFSALFAIQVVFGVFFFMSAKKENKSNAGIIDKTNQLPANNNINGVEQQKRNNPNQQITDASSACNEVLNFSNITEKTIISLAHKPNLIELIGGYFSCEAASAGDLKKCDILKNTDQKIYKRCVGINIFAQMIKEKCSDNSIKKCKELDALKESECNSSICEAVFNNQASKCSEVKGDAYDEAERYQGCLSIARGDVNLCNELDESGKSACVDEYYKASAIKNNDISITDKISNTTRRLAARAFIDNNLSCEQEFSKFTKESADYEAYKTDCLNALTDE